MYIFAFPNTFDMKYTIAQQGKLYSVIRLIKITDHHGVESLKWDFDNPLTIVDSEEKAQQFIAELLKEEKTH